MKNIIKIKRKEIERRVIKINKKSMARHRVGGRKKVYLKIIISTDTFGSSTLPTLKVSTFSAIEVAQNAPKIMTGCVFADTYLLIR